MNLNELYALKGQIITEIEVSQAKLQNVNKQIVDVLNRSMALNKEPNKELNDK